MSAYLMKSKFVQRLSVRRASVCGIDYLLTHCKDFFQILVLATPLPYPRKIFLRIYVFRFHSHGTLWKQKFQNASPTNHKTTLEIFDFAIFFREFQIHHCIPSRNKKPQFSGKRVIIEQHWVKFGTREKFRLYTCNFWNFGQLPSFMPKYDNFEISLYLGNRCP